MPSTYTTNGGIELIATGEQSGTWGDTTNDNLNIIDRLTNGVGSISLSGTTHTLTTSDGALSDGQYAVLVFGGTPSGTNTVTISPNTNQHVYIVKNNSGQSVVLTQGSGGNVTVANGKSAIVYANGGGAGAAVVDVTNTFNFQPLDAELTAIAALATTDGNFIVGNGSTWVAESGSTARTSLGLGSLATLSSIDNTNWSGTDLAVANGGTGVSTVPTNGQLLIGNGTGYTVANLTAGSGASISNGSGSITISATGSGGTVTSVSGTGTKNGLTLTGTVTTTGSLTLGGTLAISNADWSGTDLSVANGGTGASSFTANNVLLGNGTSAFQVVAPGTSGNILTSNGTTWTSAALPATVVTTTGSQTLTSKTLTDPAIIGTILEDVYTISDGAAFEVDPSNGSIQLITLGASRTPKATNFAAGEAITLMVDDGSAYTLTWTDATWGGSGVVWKTDGGVAPTLNTTGYTVITLWKVSTQVYGARVGDA